MATEKVASKKQEYQAFKDAKVEAGIEEKVDGLGRQTWDQDYFLEKAKNNVLFGPERVGKRKDPFIPLPASQRTYLQQRSADLALEKNLGKSATVTQHTIKPMQGGFWCSVCECLIKDSSSYLDHVNGRRHNRNLGMTMKVEKIGLASVKDKLKSMKKTTEAVEPENIAARIAAIEEMEDEKKRKKKEKKKRKQQKGGQGHPQEDQDDDGDEPPAKAARASGEADSGEDDAPEEESEELKMLKMMGLPTGFS